MSKKLVLIIGAPGSGKTSTLKMFTQKYPEKISGYSTGELLKEEMERGSGVGHIISNYFLKGQLVPTGIIIDVIFDAIKASPTDVVMIEGFPRKEKQVKLFGDLLFNHKEIELAEVVELQVSDVVGKERFEGPEDLYEAELEVYKETIASIEEYYREHDQLVAIDAELPQEEVFAQIEEVLRDKI